jgi:hypothetical protein
MNYFIKRDLNEFGPYTLAELQRYVASGNVLLTDSCRSEGMTEWTPVSQVIGTIPVPAAAPAPAVAAPASLYPPPPSLHWGLVLLLAILTCGIFQWVWGIVQASWIKKVQPTSKALIYYIIALVVYALAIAVRIAAPLPTRPFSGLINLGGAILWLVGAFSMKNSIEEHYNTAEPIALQLSGVMTFFFNVIYFQYHFTQIARMKEMQAMGQRVGI